jgi:drug/metabolite transporter (DMT)-like permease
MSPRLRRVVLTVLLFCLSAFWGSTFTIVRGAMAHYDVLGFLAWRFALASLVLCPVGLPRLSRAGWRAGLGVGVVLAVAFLLQTWGLRTTIPTMSGLITGLFVIFSPLSSRVLFGIRLNPRCWLAVGVSLVGLAMLTGAGAATPHLGDVLTLGCAILFGLHIALLDRTAERHDPIGLAAVQLLTCALLFGAAWGCQGHVAVPPREVWLALAATGLFASAGAYLLQTAAQRELPALEVTLIFALEPAFAAFFGWLLAGDRLAALQLAGAVLMLGALGGASLCMPPKPPPAPAAPSE